MVPADYSPSNYDGYSTTGTECYGNMAIDQDFSSPVIGRDTDQKNFKELFWAWLHEHFPTKLIYRLNEVDFVPTIKKYFWRLLFCKSGFLPNRIREIKG